MKKFFKRVWCRIWHLADEYYEFTDMVSGKPVMKCVCRACADIYLTDGGMFATRVYTNQSEAESE